MWIQSGTGVFVCPTTRSLLRAAKQAEIVWASTKEATPPRHSTSSSNWPGYSLRSVKNKKQHDTWSLLDREAWSPWRSRHCSTRPRRCDTQIGKPKRRQCSKTGSSSVVNGHEFFPAGGQQVSSRMVMSFPRGWPWFFPGGGGCQWPRGLTPLPVVAWARRTESPVVTMTWVWWRRRSTRAVAMVRGMSSSNPDGWRLEEIATARRS